MAQREVGLSAGEPPATRGYPPSVFSLLPRLLERAGAAESGSITGLYTVLVDGDDMDEPIADCARSILDGHVVLSRRLAQAGHFPTIEVLDSISRVSGAITSPEQRAAAVGLRRLLAAEREVKDLVEIGAYVPGTNPDADRALALSADIRSFLCQDMDDVAAAGESWARLGGLVGMNLSGTAS
jgi:flagellum-specific ATP synthase